MIRIIVTLFLLFFISGAVSCYFHGVNGLFIFSAQQITTELCFLSTIQTGTQQQEPLLAAEIPRYVCNTNSTRRTLSQVGQKVEDSLNFLFWLTYVNYETILKKAGIPIIQFYILCSAVMSICSILHHCTFAMSTYFS